MDLFLINASSDFRLFRNNGDGTFTNVASSSGIALNLSSGSGAWGDFNNDGYIDLFVSFNSSTPNKLYNNNGDGTFTDIAASAGVNDTAGTVSPIWGDYDNDGNLDLYVGILGSAKKLYRNNGDGTFTDIATSAGVNHSSVYSSSMAWGDFNNDGYLDIYVGDNNSANLLYRNNGDGTFTNIAASAGVADAGQAVGGGWADYDNDGDLDYHLKNNNGADRLYRNNGDGTFTDVAASAGVNVTGGSPGMGWADYDNDGDLDLYLNNNGVNWLFRNNGNNNRWLQLNLSFGNAGSIGASVFAVTGTLRQRRDVEGGAGHLSQPSPTVEFGFGNATTVDSIIVLLPSGQIHTLTNIATNQILSLTSPVDIFLPNLVATTDTINVPIQISPTDGLNILSVELSIAFDSSIATFLETETFGTLVETGWTVIENVISGTAGIDTLKIAMFTAQNALSGSGDLIYLTFDVSGSTGSTPLDFTHILLNNGIPLVSSHSGTLSTSGTNGLVSAVPDTIIPGQIITITVVDMDENKFNHVIDSFQVLVFEAVYPDSEIVWLVETGPASNTFTGVLTTEYNTSATPFNGVMSVIAGDSITVAYTDSSDSSGNVVTRFAYVQIIGGTDATVDIEPDMITPGKILNLTVTDMDLNKDSDAIDSLSVQLFTIAHADTESVWLMETGLNTGVFTNIFATEYNTSAIIDNGILSVALTDSIGMVYVDSLTAVGNTVVLYAYTEVVPYDDGQVQISYVVQALDGRNGIRDTVRVQVVDKDLNIDSGAPDQVIVTITNLVNSEVETLSLVETGNNTNTFQLRIPTIQGVTGTDNDGILTIGAWDTLVVTYVDSLTSTAVPDTLRDTCFVANLFGDAQRNNQIQAFDSSRILNISVGAEVATFQDSLVSDVDGDGFILAIDATYVSQYVVEIIDRFAIQTDTTFSAPSDSLQNHPFLKPASLDRILMLGGPSLQPDGTYILSIRLGERQGILAGNLEIGHDSWVEILDVVASRDYNSYLFASNAQPNRVHIAFSGIKSIGEGMGDVVELRFRSNTTENLPFRFTVENAFLNGQNILKLEKMIEQARISPPASYALYPNMPNPFNPETAIRYDIPEASQVQITVFNVMGQQVRSLISMYQESGQYSISWDGKDDFGRNVSSGIYLLHMRASSFLKTQKMLLLK